MQLRGLSLFVVAELLAHFAQAQNEGTLVVSELLFENEAAKNELLSRASSICQAAKQEDGVLACAFLAPRQDDGKTVITVEQFASKAAFTAHVQTPSMQDLAAWVNATSPFRSSPRVSELEVLPNFSFGKAVAAGSDPWVLISSFSYNEASTVDTTLPLWKDVVAASQQETGTLVFGAYPDNLRPERVVTVEVYTSFEAFTGVHVRGNELAALNSATVDKVTSIEGWELRLVGGYLAEGTVSA